MSIEETAMRFIPTLDAVQSLKTGQTQPFLRETAIAAMCMGCRLSKASNRVQGFCRKDGKPPASEQIHRALFALVLNIFGFFQYALSYFQ